MAKRFHYLFDAVCAHYCISCNRRFVSSRSYALHLRREHTIEVQTVSVQLKRLTTSSNSSSTDYEVVDARPAKRVAEEGSKTIAARRNLPNVHSSRLLFLDFETGGLSATASDILQIGAVCGQSRFNCYVIPTRPLSPFASRVNKLTFSDGALYYRKKKVAATTLKNGLNRFMSFLETLPEDLIVVAHNARFDSRFLIENASQLGLTAYFSSKLWGFVDTVPLFKASYPRLESHRQSAIVRHFYPSSSYESHNALEDVLFLQKLFHEKLWPKITMEDMLKCSFTTEDALVKRVASINANKNLSSYQTLIQEGVISMTTAKKMSEHNLSLHDLRSIFNASGEEGLHKFFKSDERSPRVALSDPVIQKILIHFSGGS